MLLAPGQSLSCYEILSDLGAGAMGEVYRARDTRLGRDVAIKVLPRQFAEDAERLQRFEREARLLATLNHPHVAQVYGFDQVDEVRFIAMELVPGEDLGARLVRGPMSVEEAIEVGRQVAEGLEAAHEAGVVHRDLKPGNVQVTPDGTVKLLDFGLAKADANGLATDVAATTLTHDCALPDDVGRLLGTPTYMPPEQARGRPVDRRADIWAFGCVLYECLTGKRLFAGETLPDVLAAVLHEDPDLSALPADTPQHVRELLARCLDKDPRQRLRDVGEARWALQPGRQRRSERVSPSRPPRRGVPLLPVLALVAVGFALGWWLRPDPRRPAPVQVRDITFTGTDRQPDVSGDGRLIAFTSSRDGVSRIWVRQVEGGAETALTEGPDWRPRFSPSGTSVGFIRRAGTQYSAYRVPSVGGQARKLLDHVHDLAWSADERRLAVVRGPSSGRERGATLEVLDLETGATRTLLDSSNGRILGVSWSPVSGKIAISRGRRTADSRLLIIDPDDGSTQAVPIEGANLLSVPAWLGGHALLYVKATSAVPGAGRPDAIMCYDLRSGQEQPLLGEPFLFPHPNPFSEASRLSLLPPGRLVFDNFRRVQRISVLDRTSGALRALTSGVAADRQPTFSPDGSRLMFTSNRSGNMDLYAYDFQTERVLQLTDHPGNDWDGAFAPDGRSIVWSSERSGHLEIWRADADGANPRQVTRLGASAENPTLTADGRWIVFTVDGGEQNGIFRIHPDGTGLSRLLEGEWSTPEVSPDGRHVLVVTGNEQDLRVQVRVVAVDSGEFVEFAIDIEYGPGSAHVTYGRSRWLPDGSGIVFLGVDANQQPMLYIQDFAPGRDTTSTRRAVEGAGDLGIVESFGLSRDGRWAAIATTQAIQALRLAEGLPGLQTK